MISSLETLLGKVELIMNGVYLRSPEAENAFLSKRAWATENHSASANPLQFKHHICRFFAMTYFNVVQLAPRKSTFANDSC